MTLKKYLAPKGRIPRGGISRLAEFMQCTHYRATQLAWGAPPKDDREKRLIGYFIAQQVEIVAFKPGPKKLRCGSTSEKLRANRVLK